MTPKSFATAPLRNLPLTLLVLLYMGLRSFYFDHVPIWDGRDYYNYILTAQRQPFDWLNYSAMHNAQAWLLLAGIPNHFFPDSYYAYNVWVAFLSTTGVVAFYLIVTELSGDALSRMERCLITALFAFHPSVLVAQIHATPDTGLLLFWLWYLLALLKDKRLLATLFGCCLLFCKEPALVHLPILFVFCMLLKPSGLRKQWAIANKIAVLLPAALMALYLIYKTAILNKPLFFLGFLQKDHGWIRVKVDDTLINYLFAGFILNFNWILTLAGITLAVMAALLHRREYKKYALAFAWLLITTLFTVLIVRAWANVRYMAPLFPSMILIVAYLLPLISRSALRMAIITTILALLVWENFRTIDPLSKEVLCTTNFGEHTIIEIPPFGVCAFHSHPGWFMRDMVVYNLEFTHYPELVFRMVKDVHPTNKTVFIADWVFLADFMMGLNAKYEPVFGTPAIQPIYLEMADRHLHDARYITALPPEIYFIDVPGMLKDHYRTFFSSHYAKEEEKIYEIDGYETRLVHYSDKKPFQKK